jgi:hydroxyacyl-ACP dehydratase HTD2-like protein with hotdog domain
MAMTAHKIPDLVITPTHAQVFMFSAATWNRHHIHYSKDAALAEGLPDVVVQRGLIGNFLARLVTSWLREGGEIRELSWKVVQSALPGKPLRCQGVVTGEQAAGASRFVICELKVVNDQEQTIATGEAEVELNSTFDSRAE